LYNRIDNRDNTLGWIHRTSHFQTNAALEDTIDDYPDRPLQVKMRDGFRHKLKKEKWRQSGVKNERHFWPVHLDGRWDPLKATSASGKRLLREFKMLHRFKHAPPVSRAALEQVASTMADAEAFRQEYHDDAEAGKTEKLLSFD